MSRVSGVLARRSTKIVLAVLVVLLLVLILNSIVVNHQTKDAGVNVEGARILSTSTGNVQVTDDGPRGDSAPIVLIHCYTCSIKWWEGILPLLDKEHRVIRVDLLGHGGSEKPAEGYGMDDQAGMVAEVLAQLQVTGATVVGHSMGFTVATALAERSPDLVARLVDIDQAPDDNNFHQSVTQKLSRVSLLGQAMWRTTPDWAVRDAYKEIFAPGYNMASGFEDPDQPVNDLREMTYKSYTQSFDGTDGFEDEKPLDQRLLALGKPLLVIFGTDDQPFEPAEESAHAYDDVPGVQIEMIDGAGHSPNVEKPSETAALILAFAATPKHPAAKKKHSKKKRK